jgi:hypothetical protein
MIPSLRRIHYVHNKLTPGRLLGWPTRSSLILSPGHSSVLHADHTAGRDIWGAQQLDFISLETTELRHLCTATCVCVSRGPHTWLGHRVMRCCARAQIVRLQAEPSCTRRRSENASAPRPCQRSRSTDLSRHHPCKDDHRDHAG